MERQLLLTISEWFILTDEWIFSLLYKSQKTKLCLLSIQDHSMHPRIPKMPTWLINLNDMYFYKIFRLQRCNFELLLNVIRAVDVTQLLQLKYRGGHYPINDKFQLLVFLKYISSQDTLISIATSFEISPSTALNIVNKMLFFTLKLKNAYIKFPTTEEQLHTLSESFEKYPGEFIFTHSLGSNEQYFYFEFQVQ